MGSDRERIDRAKRQILWGPVPTSDLEVATRAIDQLWSSLVIFAVFASAGGRLPGFWGPTAGRKIGPRTGSPASSLDGCSMKDRGREDRGNSRWLLWLWVTLVTNVLIALLIPALNVPNASLHQPASGVACLIPVPLGPLFLALKRSRREAIVAFVTFALSVFWALLAYSMLLM